MNQNSYSVLFVDDDHDVLESYSYLASISGLIAKTIDDPTSALNHLHKDWVGVVVLDMYMPKMHGLELLRQIKELDPNIPVIIVTGHGDIPIAVDAVKKGACEFMEKPINPPELLETIKTQIGFRKSFIEQKDKVSKKICQELAGKSAQLNEIRQDIARYALLDTHLIIWGETGTGRHHIANLIAQSGSLTHTPKEFRLANESDGFRLNEHLDSSTSGILFLYDLDTLDEKEQRQLAHKLLCCERNEQHRVRIIGIFETNPEVLVANQSLLPELYFLLNRGMVKVPPLRQRPDDIAPIFHYFLKQSCRNLGKTIPKVSSHYLSVLRHHSWRGNVRELRNIAELYAVGIVKLTGNERTYSKEEIKSPLDELVDEYEKQLIEDALYLHSGKVTEAANQLHITRKKLYLRMRKYNIEKDNYKTR
ncbi:sigma-54-dependent transcriptional regulator [Vibrio sp. HN007]|uniref:sigma-54-dependent transcriptional regulator n=1 Tax=Vibrio iocasae TaxID=3098914 RepID=UPI0035D44F35